MNIMLNEIGFVVVCTNNRGREMYLKTGSQYTVIINYFIGAAEFYRLKEVKNMGFESHRFTLAPKPGFSAPVVKVEEEEEEYRKAA